MKSNSGPQVGARVQPTMLRVREILVRLVEIRMLSLLLRATQLKTRGGRVTAGFPLLRRSTAEDYGFFAVGFAPFSGFTSTSVALIV